MDENKFDPSYERSKDEAQSLDLFHEGQKAALNSDGTAAIAKLEESLIIANKGSDSEWISYIEGTIADLSGDLASLNEHIPSSGANAEILSKLAQGLERRQSVDYKVDYES